MADQEQHTSDWRPIPDPTVLTTQALSAAIAALEDKLSARLNGLEANLETRLKGMDRAQELFQAGLNRIPTEVELRVSNLEQVHAEKFRSVDKQFDERDVRAEQSALQVKIAVDAALQAAEKAVGKSELVTVKQIDAQGSLIHTATGALRDQLDDVKDRVTRIEGQSLGTLGQKAEHNTSSHLIIAVIGIGLAILSSALALFALLRGMAGGH